MGLARFVDTFQNVLLPPIVAGIMAMLLRPYYDLLVKVCRGYQPGGLVLFFLFALIPLGVLTWFGGIFAAKQLIRLFEDLPSMLNSILEAVPLTAFVVVFWRLLKKKYISEVM